MYGNFWFDLQYFAEGAGAAPGGEGGGGPAAGVTSVDAGQKALEGLGVPTERADKWAKSRARRDIPAAAVDTHVATDRRMDVGIHPYEEHVARETRVAINEDAQQTETGDADRNEDKLGARRTSPARRDEPRKSWEEILSDPAYKQAFDSQVQGIIRQRLAKASRTQQTFDKLRPALEFLATKYRLPTENLDYDALASAIQADDSIVAGYADERGTSLETAREDLKDKLELERLRRESRITMDRQAVEAHLNRLRAQAEEVRQYDPDFDVEREIAENAVFARMTSPQIGMNAADAYFAVHRREILARRDEAQAQKAIAAVTGEGGLTEDASSHCHLTPAVINRAVTKMKKDRVPRIGGKYVAVIHPSVAEDLRNEDAWIEAHKYAAPEELFNGEIGELHGVRFIEDVFAPVFQGEDLASDSRSLRINYGSGYSGAITSVAFDGGTVAADALIGRTILINGVKAVVTDNTDSSITFASTDFGSIADNTDIFPGEGAGGGVAMYATYFFGQDAFGIIDPEGGALEMIVHDKSEIGGPLNQFSTIGYKFETNGATILYPERLLRVMSTSSYSATDEAN